jgi:hypothetical protein
MTDQQISQVYLPSQGNIFPLEGECDGRFALTLVNAGFLQRLLPPDLELASNPFSQQGRHPLMLMFDKVTLRMNDNLERIAAEYQLKATEHQLNLELNYNEFIAMLPYVRFKEDTSLADGIDYCFLPVLYLDSLLAVIGGRIFWEFNKRLSRFAIDPTTYQVKSWLGTVLLSSTGTMDGDPIPGSSVPNFVAITPILDLPVIEYGKVGYVSSIYKVEYQNQVIRPSSIHFSNRSSEYLPAGSLDVPSIRQNVMGCFDMTYNWKLSFIKFHPKQS